MSTATSAKRIQLNEKARALCERAYRAGYDRTTDFTPQHFEAVIANAPELDDAAKAYVKQLVGCVNAAYSEGLINRANKSRKEHKTNGKN